MLAERTTLAQFLIEERRRHPGASGDLNALILDVALACKAISNKVAVGALGNVLGSAEQTNVQGEVQQKLDVIANDYFLRATEWNGHVAGLASEELDDPYKLPDQYPRGKYLLVFDPLDGSSNIDVNVSVGSIFSVLRAPDPGRDPAPEHFLQPGVEQVCAGYAIYGPSTILVLTLGNGAHAFTLDTVLGEFILTRVGIRIADSASEFAINASNNRFWEPAVRRYVDECLAGRAGPREKDFNMRWVASLVAETHRILTRGGVFLYPRDSKDAAKPGKLRLLYEANPVAMIVEQAGGMASTGRGRVLDLAPSELHERVPLIFGSRDEVQRLDQYHREQHDRPYDSPLYATRGLFRTATG
ncbi:MULTISPECIES: class 1 fructose-bisphosphatase [Pseudonocardia]|uniref:Fructose-1,6-bisphosphatase class 1 n=2 Tax=Pseudonocardia TaxID=1847 RepID=A0A1Y2MHT8_PSEAH|nr:MULTISPECIES: class 1 fructose-bisphosphatase [Pseudonocardia]OSY34641.1 Fructose-1,6-bisphosphatase class 1 [Pseudonocardia autotrophica]TDN76425.1 D-fructose 1,6-bisphosphatase [Pseudonocardia autotrophica]BBG00419.1 fructose-1,6-bisphosphatase class 1 [Pseudonocardia autotrophica]GEC29762.1 fructose-1,6-bisphosphatase class 1 [Pseudonocardia saturnea]